MVDNQQQQHQQQHHYHHQYLCLLHTQSLSISLSSSLAADGGPGDRMAVRADGGHGRTVAAQGQSGGGRLAQVKPTSPPSNSHSLFLSLFSLSWAHVSRRSEG